MPESIGFAQAGEDFRQARQKAALQGMLARLTGKSNDLLPFTDILVPLSGAESGWLALDQAIVLAQREGSRILGLHVTSDVPAAQGQADCFAPLATTQRNDTPQ